MKLRGFTVRVKVENGLRFVENRRRRRILRSKGQEVKRERKLHNEKVHVLCCSPDIVKKSESKVTCSMYGEIRNTYRFLAGEA
jgi:hypothetical protein